MNCKISQQPLAARFEHLLGVIGGQRFLQMKGLNNDLPFYICEFRASEAFDMQRMQKQLTSKLAGMRILCNLALLCARGKVEVRQDSNALEGDALERALRNTNAHSSLVLEPQVEFSASQVRHLKEFFADFFDAPASSNEARALARETIDAIKNLEIELAGLLGQKASYPFLGVLGGVLATLKEIAAKDPNWFLTDLSRADEALLDTREQIIEPLRRFMSGPQRDIYDQARQLMQDQEDNLAYVGGGEVGTIKALLAADKPWQGNGLQQIRPQLETLQHDINRQLDKEKAAAVAHLDDLQQRLQAADEYARLDATRKEPLTQAFSEARQSLQSQKRIAMIRDQLRRFEESRYPALLQQMNTAAQPQAAASPVPDTAADSAAGANANTGGSPTAAVPAVTEPPGLVPARTIHVAYAKPWLANESDLDEYLQQQRAAWLKEIRAGNRVQI
jgi:hypothetical protein